MRLIGINGYKTAGKDSTFQAVQARVSDRLNVQRAGFADKLKIMAAKAIGYDAPDEDLIAWMDEAKQCWEFNVIRKPECETISQFSGRQYLQWFGGHARTVFGDSFWVDQVLPKPIGDPIGNSLALKRRYPGIDILCVTDVRYPNEAHRVLDLGGEVWVVERPGLESDGHSSEEPLPAELVNFTIPNDGTLLELEERVAAFV